METLKDWIVDYCANKTLYNDPMYKYKPVPKVQKAMEDTALGLLEFAREESFPLFGSQIIRLELLEQYILGTKGTK